MPIRALPTFLRGEHQVDEQDAKRKNGKQSNGQNQQVVARGELCEHAHYFFPLQRLRRCGLDRRRRSRNRRRDFVSNCGVNCLTRARCMNVLHDLIHGLLKNLEKWLGIEADPESHNQQWNEGQHFARGKVVQFFIFRIGNRAKENALIEPE